MQSLKTLAASAPVLGPATVKLQGLWWRWRRRARQFRTSARYWETRYRTGGNSGAGSDGRLAHFKAEVINDFVREHTIGSVVEWGCGDGRQLSLAAYPRYTGLDVSKAAVALCKARFRNDPTKSFFVTDGILLRQRGDTIKADLSLSLDVIFHVVEDAAFEQYMSALFNSAERFVIIYSSNVDQEWSAAHVRHRRFSAWIETHRPEWELFNKIPNKYPYHPDRPAETSFSDFFFFRRRHDHDESPERELGL